MKKIKLLIILVLVMFGVTLISGYSAELNAYALEDNPDRPLYERNLIFSPIKAPDYVDLKDNKNETADYPILKPEDYPNTDEGKKQEGGIWYNIFIHTDAKLFYIIYDPGISDVKVQFDITNAPIERYLGKERKKITVNLKSNGNYRLESHIDYGGEELAVVRNDDFSVVKIDYSAPVITYKRVTFIDGSLKIKFTVNDKYYGGGDTSAGSGIKKITFYEMISETEDRVIKTVVPDKAPSVQPTLEISFDVLISEKGVYGVKLEDNVGNSRDIFVWEIDEEMGGDVDLLNSAQNYINRAEEFNPKLISELKLCADEFRYTNNNKYASEEEKKSAKTALQLSLNKMNAAKKEVKITINNQDLLKNGNLYHNISIDKHFPDAKFGDDIRVNINLSIYTKKSTFNNEIVKAVDFKVDEILKLDFLVTLNGEEYKVKLPINIQMALYNDYKEYRLLIAETNNKFTDLEYKQGNGFIIFDLTDAKGTVFMPIDKGLGIVFYIIIGVLAAVLITVTVILIIKKRKVTHTKSTDSDTENSDDESKEAQKDNQDTVKEIPKNKSKKKKRGKK